jgi:hypothetical protein
MIFTGLMKAMTTKLQRQLARRRYTLMVGEPNEDTSTDSSGSDFDFPTTLPVDKVTKTLSCDLHKVKFGVYDDKPLDDETKVEMIDNLTPGRPSINNFVNAKLRRRQ